MITKRIISLFMVMVLIITVTPFQLANAAANDIPHVTTITDIAIGDYVTMGEYNSEPIVWRCVDIDENGPLMLSDKIICFKAYDVAGNYPVYLRRVHGSNHWEDSSLNHWLNSEGVVDWSGRASVPNAASTFDGHNPYDTEIGFLSSFNEAEKNYIKPVRQKTYLHDLERSLAEGGTREFNIGTTEQTSLTSFSTGLSGWSANTYYYTSEDTFFLLGPEQVKAVYDNLGSSYLLARATDGARENDDSRTTTADVNYRYWLRVPCNFGMSYENLRIMDNTEQLSCAGVRGAMNGENYHSIGVRPAFYLNITKPQSGKFKYAGFVNQEKDSESTYYYSDSYFNADATKITNPHLATMSLCLELSSWSSWEADNTAVWKPEEKTRNVAALFDVLGYKNFEWSPDWNQAPDRNSMGAVAAYRNIPNSNTTVIALAVRGGGYYDEWGGNFLLGSEGDHEGFVIGRDRVLSFLDSYILKYIDDEKYPFNQEVKIWIVGFSRGGAVANLVAGELTDGTKCGGREFSPKNIFAYTFEAPQGYIGLNEGYSNIKNFVFTYDLVPLVAPSVWGFERYNKHDNLILDPTVVTTDYFINTETMLTQYQKVLAGVPEYDEDKAEYKIEPFVQVFSPSLEIESDWMWKWATGGLKGLLNSVEIDWIKSEPTPVMLNDAMSHIFNSIPNGRSGYATSMEEVVTQLLDFLCSFDKSIDVNKFIRDAFLGDDMEGIKRINACLLDPTLTQEQKKEELQVILLDRIEAALGKQLVSYSAIAEALPTVIILLADVLLTDIGLVFPLIMYCCGTGFQCHWPEVALAWMMSSDSYYEGSNTFSSECPESFRIAYIKCPVDVSVRDENGAEIASINNGSVDNSGMSAAHGCSVTEAGTKRIILPADADYTIEIAATDDGVMDYSVYEYNLRDRKYNLLQSYQNMPLSTGCVYTGIIPKFEEADYFDAESDGSSINYRLITPDGIDAQPDIDLRGEDVTYATVSVSTNNNRGVADGSGAYVIHSQALVRAACMPTAEFLGWYQNGQLVSTELDYSFEVTEDVELVAYFSEGDYHTLTVTCTEGGQIAEGSRELPSGIEIGIEAEAHEGYEFVAWECSDGSFDDYSNIEAQFTMPSADATVTAVFKKSVLPPQDTPSGIFTAADTNSGSMTNVSSGMKYSVDGGTTWNEITEDGMVITGVTEENDIMLYMPGNGTTTTDSEIQTIDVTQADTPMLVASQPTTINGTGSIPTDASHEYSVDGINWISCTGSMTELVPGDYYVRVKASGTVLASETQTITIVAFDATQEATPAALFDATGTNNGTLNNVSAGMKYSVDGGTTWNEITEDGMTISGVTEQNDIMLYVPGNGTTTTDSEIQTIDVTQADTPMLVASQPTTINGTGSILTTASHEYSVDGINWNSCTGSMTDLVPGNYYVRVKASGTVLASETQTITIVAFDATQEATPAAVFNATGTDNGTLNNVSSGMKYSVDGGTTWNEITEDGMVITGVTEGNDIMLYMPGNGTTTTDSEIQTIDVTRAATPTLVASQPTTINGTGSIPTDASHEYSVDGINWNSCTGSMTELVPGDYYVRVKASGTVLASETQTITIVAFDATQEATPAAVFNATGTDGGSLNNVSSGMKYSVDGGATWNEITEDGMPISGVTEQNDIMLYMPGNGTTTTDSEIQTIDVSQAVTPTLVASQPTTINGTGSIPTDASHEYSVDGINWISCTGSMTDLVSGDYYVRVKASGTVLASETQTIAITAFDATQEATPAAVFNATGTDGGSLNNVSSGVKYSVDGGATWNEITEDGMTISGVTEQNDIMLYMPGNGTTTTDSEIQTIDVTRAATPTLVASQPTTINGTGSIPTNTSHEYSVDGINWISCTGSMIDLVPGTYYVRVKANGTILASEAQQITISAVNVAQVPVIDRQPESSNYTINEKPSAMIVGASTNDGGTLSYQWYSSTSSGYEHGTPIPGANTSSYLPLTNELGTTYYYCVITNTNGENVAYAISSIAQIVVREATVPPQTGDRFPLLLCLLLNAMAITVFCAQQRKSRRGNK